MSKTTYERRFTYVVQVVAAIVFFSLIVAQALGLLQNEPPLMLYGLLAGIFLGVGRVEDLIKLGGTKK